MNIGRLCTKRTNREYILVGLANVYTGDEYLHALFTNASSDRCGALPEVSRAESPTALERVSNRDKGMAAFASFLPSRAVGRHGLLRRVANR
jgi:hypothetical protein